MGVCCYKDRWSDRIDGVQAVNSRAVAYRESTQTRHKLKMLFKIHRTSRKLVKRTKMADLY